MKSTYAWFSCELQFLNWKRGHQDCAPSIGRQVVMAYFLGKIYSCEFGMVGNNFVCVYMYYFKIVLLYYYLGVFVAQSFLGLFLYLNYYFAYNK